MSDGALWGGIGIPETSFQYLWGWGHSHKNL